MGLGGSGFTPSRTAREVLSASVLLARSLLRDETDFDSFAGRGGSGFTSSRTARQVLSAPVPLVPYTVCRNTVLPYYRLGLFLEPEEASAPTSRLLRREVRPGL